MPSMPRMGESMTSMFGAAVFYRAGADSVDGQLAGFGVADDAAFAYVETAGFELGFDEDDCFALPVFFGRGQRGEDCGQDERGRDKGDVHGEEGKVPSTLEFAGDEEAGVGAFAQ